MGSAQCPSALLPTQQGELDPPSREGKNSSCATSHNFVTWSFYWCASSEQGDAVSSPQFLIQMATGSGHQIKHRALVPDYFFPVAHRTGSNRLGKPSTLLCFLVRQKDINFTSLLSHRRSPVCVKAYSLIRALIIYICYRLTPRCLHSATPLAAMLTTTHTAALHLY